MKMAQANPRRIPRVAVVTHLYSDPGPFNRQGALVPGADSVIWRNRKPRACLLRLMHTGGGTRLLPSHVSWANWDHLYLDSAIWEAAVRQVISDLEFSVRSMQAGFPGTSAVFKAECSPLGPAAPRQEQHACMLAGEDSRGLIVKFFPPMVHRDFIAERSVYRALSPARSSPPHSFWQPERCETLSSGPTWFSKKAAGLRYETYGTSLLPMT